MLDKSVALTEFARSLSDPRDGRPDCDYTGAASISALTAWWSTPRFL